MLSVNLNAVSACGFELLIDILLDITTKLLLNECLVVDYWKNCYFCVPKI